MRSGLYTTTRPPGHPALALPQIRGSSPTAVCYVTSRREFEGLPPSDAIYVHSLSRSVAARAAYAFGEWPPAPAHLRGRPAEIVASMEEDFADHVARGHPLTYAPMTREDPRCRHCGLVSAGHTDTEVPAGPGLGMLRYLLCDELALRAAWGDR